MDDLVLRWDEKRENKGKHGKFDNIWFGPFKIVEILDDNTFVLNNLDDHDIIGSPVNEHFLKHFYIH